MSKLYEMCNDIDSNEILNSKEQLTLDERKKLLEHLKREGIVLENSKRNV